MATEKTTRQQVEELAAKGKSAKEISEALKKTPATIYNHLRNIEADGGKVNKSTTRGRPRADATETPASEETPKPRPNPRAKADSGDAAKANVFASNGHSENADVISILMAEKAKHEAAIQKLDTAIAALVA